MRLRRKRSRFKPRPIHFLRSNLGTCVSCERNGKKLRLCCNCCSRKCIKKITTNKYSSNAQQYRQQILKYCAKTLNYHNKTNILKECKDICPRNWRKVSKRVTDFDCKDRRITQKVQVLRCAKNGVSPTLKQFCFAVDDFVFFVLLLCVTIANCTLQ